MSQTLEELVEIAVGHQRRKRWRPALDAWDQAIEAFPEDVRGHAGRAETRLMQGDFVGAGEAFAAIEARWPQRPEGPQGRARILSRTECGREAVAAWRELCERFPKRLAAHRGLADALLEAGDFTEADRAFADLNERWPDRPEGRAGLARVAEMQEQWDDALEIWDGVIRTHPDWVKAYAGSSKCLAELNRFDEAHARCDEIEERFGAEAAAVPRSVVCLLGGDRPGAQEALGDARAETVGAARLAVLRSDLEDPEERLAMLEAAHAEHPDSLAVMVALAKACIEQGRRDEAIRVVDSIPSAHQRQWVRRLRAWAEAARGDIEAARWEWQPLRRSPLFQNRLGPTDALRRRDRLVIPGGPREIRLFSVVRNENDRLPWFLRYYRNLGVDRFFFVDNDSDDGTAEYLLEQPDVHVFWTDDSYGESRFGVRWLNRLTEEYGGSHWCMYIDVDEQLLYPGVEQLGLRHVTRYLEAHGHEAMRGFMLDMYADPLGAAEYRPGDEPLGACSLFDRAHRTVGQIDAPYIRIRGGMRQRVFWPSGVGPVQSKTPLFRGDRDIKLLASSHVVTPALVSDVSCVLLHFKFLGDYAARIAEEISRGEHAAGGRQYIMYREGMEAEGPEMSVVADVTERYTGSAQLIDLGLMDEPEAYRGMTPLPEHRRSR